MTDWTSLNFVVVDVEGNGQQPPDLVELAAVPIIDGVIGAPSSWLVRPDTPITHFARKVHGITDDAVADAPVFDAIKPQVTKALVADVLIAHNAHVDVGVLQRKLGVLVDGGDPGPAARPALFTPHSPSTCPTPLPPTYGGCSEHEVCRESRLCRRMRFSVSSACWVGLLRRDSDKAKGAAR